MRIIVGGISHETNTFTPVTTSLRSFKERFYMRGNEIIENFRETNTPIGGFIDGAKHHDITIIPTIFAEALPSNTTPEPIFNSILKDLLESISEAGSIDGVLLDLHGSMVVGDIDGPSGISDAEGHILTAIRQLVGNDVPVVAQLDIHANVSQQMIDQADVLIGRDTCPEIDMADRGRECLDIIMRMLKREVNPTMAFKPINMIWGWNQLTSFPPMSEAMAELKKNNKHVGVLCGSISLGFPDSDTPDMGASVSIVTDNNQPLAQKLANQLSTWIYERRSDWHISLPSTKDVLQQIKNTGKYPAMFADTNDNTGRGTPGDSTGMLRAFIDEKLEDACVLYMVDPESVAICQEAGIGAKIDLAIGGKSSPLQGEPVKMHAEIRSLVDGHFRYDGPMYAGLSAEMGPSAYIRENGIHVLLVSIREQPYDSSFSRIAGLDLEKMRYIGVKSSVHFRANFSQWVKAIYTVGEPSVVSKENLSFKRLGRAVYPFEHYDERARVYKSYP